MTHGSVFSGIGGPEVAASMLGWENLFHCEINPFGRKILDYWYPNAESYEDITKTDFSKWRGKVNVLTGGFPCQPFSVAGRRAGAEDDRYLWPYMFRCIDQIQPDWVVAENVGGILTMVEQGEVVKVASAPNLFDEGNAVRGQFRLRETFTLERICSDLEGHGYEAQPILIPACSVGAPHRRDRVFILARRKDVDDADTNRNHAGGLREGGAVERERGDEHLQPSEQPEWKRTAPRPADVYGILRLAADYDLSRLQGVGRPERQADGTQSETRQGNGTIGNGEGRFAADTQEQQGGFLRPEQREDSEPQSQELGGRDSQIGDEWTSADDVYEGLQRWLHGDTQGQGNPADRYIGLLHSDNGTAGGGRWDSFPTQSPVHRGNDGISFDVDRLTISFAKWRTESLKAYGNAIVPQVMYEIFRAIEKVEEI